MNNRKKRICILFCVCENDFLYKKGKNGGSVKKWFKENEKNNQHWKLFLFFFTTAAYDDDDEKLNKGESDNFLYLIAVFLFCKIFNWWYMKS